MLPSGFLRIQLHRGDLNGDRHEDLSPAAVCHDLCIGTEKRASRDLPGHGLASCVCPPGASALHENKGPVLWDDFGSQPWLRATGFQALLDARMMSVR